MNQHAFVDETRRGDRYFVAVALVNPRHVGRHRRELRKLLLPGQRELHFKKEGRQRRKQLADRIVAMGIRVRIYSRRCCTGEEKARQDCLRGMALDLIELKVERLLLDSRQTQDRFDNRTLRDAFEPCLSRWEITYYHVDSTTEPLMWIADAVGWCYGAGGEWRQRVGKLVSAEVDLDLPGDAVA